jgi:hypothetical protein
LTAHNGPGGGTGTYTAATLGSNNQPVQQSGLTVTIPSTPPVVGATQAWFGGRVYAPSAIVTSPNTVSLVYAGYNTGYAESGTSRDLSNYRTIGQVNLAVTNGVALP